MAKVRTYEEGQIQAAPLPASRFSPSATGDSFGGGKAKDLKELGAGLQSLGEGAGKLAAVYQAQSNDRKDKAIVRDTLNQADSDLRTFEGEMNRPENREKALDAYATSQKAMTDLRKKYAASLKNDRQRDLFTASFDAQMNGVLDRSYALQERSRLEFEKLTRDAQNQSAVENAVAARTDANAIKNSEVTIVANTNANTIGLPKDVRQKAVSEARHNLHASVLSALTLDDPRAAQGYLKTNWDKFNPAAREALKKDLDDKAFDWTVRTDAAKLVGAGLNDQQIEEELGKIQDPKKAEAMRREVKVKLEERQIAREIQTKENSYSMWQNVIGGGDIPYGRVSGTEIKAMENYKRAALKGFAQDSDRATLISLGRLSDQELKEIDEVTMAGYGEKLSKSDFDAFFGRYRDLRRSNEIGLEGDKLSQIRSDSAMVTDALTALGIDPQLEKKGGFLGIGAGKKNPVEKAADQKIINDLSRSFEREINDQEKAKGRKLAPEEKQTILDSLLIKGKNKKFVFQSADVDEKNFSIKDIPLNLQQQMQAAFAMRKIPATPENIKTYYLEYLRRKQK